MLRAVIDAVSMKCKSKKPDLPRPGMLAARA
jgi:hypothetical protein